MSPRLHQRAHPTPHPRQAYRLRGVYACAHSCRCSSHTRGSRSPSTVLAAVALVPAFVWLAPPSDWDQPGLLLVLLALAVIADVTEITLPNGLSFDAACELVLITLVILGPAPRVAGRRCVPLAIGGLIRGERIIRHGNLANVAAFGWETSRAPLCCRRPACTRPRLAEALPWLLLAGAGHVRRRRSSIGPASYVPLYLGHPWSAGAADAGRPAARHDRDGHARRRHRRALPDARRARPGAVRADRRAAADGAVPRRPHPPGRRAGAADRHAPLRVRAGAAPRPRPRRAPPPRSA